MAPGDPTLTMRKPLYPKERDTSPCQITVTGAESYIGAAVIERLLVAGHTVHATWRGKDSTTIKHLLDMKNAATHLRLFAADLMEPGSFELPLRGSRYLIHMASLRDVDIPKHEAEERLVKAAVMGVENVLTSALYTETLEKVVVTSSLAAVVGSRESKIAGYLYNEADWNEVASETNLPYLRSKTLAEQRAYEISAMPDCKWTLATICPAVVQGPLAGKIKVEATDFMANVLKGSYYPIGAPLRMPFADIDDVAAAHCLALAIPEANGRYIICSETMLMSEYVDLLRPKYSYLKLTYFWLPSWLMELLISFRIRPTGYTGYDLNLVPKFFSNSPHFDSAKSRRVLGLEYTEMASTAIDMADSVFKHGLVYG